MVRRVSGGLRFNPRYDERRQTQDSCTPDRGSFFSRGAIGSGLSASLNLRPSHKMFPK